jgi:hypothetical protein
MSFHFLIPLKVTQRPMNLQIPQQLSLVDLLRFDYEIIASTPITKEPQEVRKEMMKYSKQLNLIIKFPQT